MRVYSEFKLTYAMVIYGNMQAAIAAVDETNDTLLFDKGRRVVVDFSKFNSDDRGARFYLKTGKNKGINTGSSNGAASSGSSSE